MQKPDLRKPVFKLIPQAAKNINENLCGFPPCGKPITEFRDEASRREYGISGICQNCQDSIFG